MCEDELRRTSGFNLQGYWKHRLSIRLMRAAPLRARHSRQAARTRPHLGALQRSGTRTPRAPVGRPGPPESRNGSSWGRAGGRSARRSLPGWGAGGRSVVAPPRRLSGPRGRALCAGSALASRWRRWRINRSTSTGG